MSIEMLCVHNSLTSWKVSVPFWFCNEIALLVNATSRKAGMASAILPPTILFRYLISLYTV